jgi:hypothetical protein
MPSNKTFLEQCDKVPPCIVRWNAYEWSQSGARLLSNPELARRCALAERMIQRLGSKKSWAGVKADVMSKFIKGCNADLFDLAWYASFLDKFADDNFPHVTDKRVRKNVGKIMGWKL